MLFPWQAIPDNPQARGLWAEQRATRYLQWRAWRLCARNWIGGGGELDIVCSRWKTLLIAEVRFRSDDLPFLSIDQQKIDHLRSSAAALIKQHQLYDYAVRFDALGVSSNGHIEQRCGICSL